MTGVRPEGACGVTAVIPTLDEEATVAEVVTRCRPFVDEVLVVDGGSRDRTVEICRGLGARCEFDDRRGKGSALREGARLAKHPILVFIDADGSHVPEDIPKLVAPIVRGEADLVIASRLLGGSSELHGGFDEFLRLSGSSFITACINRRWGVRLSDSQNGFRAVRADAFRGLGLVSDHTTIEQETIMRALSAGLRVLDVPSHEHPRGGGVSKVSVFSMWHLYLASLARGLLLPRRRT